MNSTSLLNRRISKIHDRLSKLYEDASVSLSPDLLPTALMELGIVSEALQMMMKEVSNQNELLQNIQASIEAECSRSSRLAQLISDGYLVVDAQMQVQAVNPAAVFLFNSSRTALVGASLISLLEAEDCEALQERLAQLNLAERDHFVVHFRKQPNKLLKTSIVVEKGWDWHTKAPVFYLFLKDAVEHSPDLVSESDNSLFAKYPTQNYCKGDLISLEYQPLCIVAAGTVKLTTLTEQGEEILLGLLGRSMILGTKLTTLQTYQAVALTDTRLLSIPMSDLMQSPALMQAVWPLLIHRLQQTEQFLSVYGQMRIEDRLEQLLKLLSQEIGEPTEAGVRLAVRWTHQDLASACGTTRVTITRLLGKFQQQQKVNVDAKNHLILLSS